MACVSLSALSGRVHGRESCCRICVRIAARPMQNFEPARATAQDALNRQVDQEIEFRDMLFTLIGPCTIR